MVVVSLLWDTQLVRWFVMVYVCFSLSTFTFSIQIDPFVGAFHIFWLFLQRERCVKVNIVSTSSILCVYVSL